MARIAYLLVLVLTLHVMVLAGGVLTAQEGLFSFLSPGRSRLANNLKQMALAMHNYHDTYKSMPPTGLDYSPRSGAKPGKPVQQLSWRVRVLPFLLEEAELYDKFNFNEPWDGPTNKPLLAQMPDIFKSPGAKVEDPTKTVFQVVTMAADSAAFEKATREAHPDQRRIQTVFDTIFNSKRPPGYATNRFSSMLDGTSNSVMIVEVDPKHAVPWTKPDDLAFEFDKPWAKLGTLRKGYINFAMADGSVGAVQKKLVSDQILRDAFFISDLRNNKFRDMILGVKY